MPTTIRLRTCGRHRPDESADRAKGSVSTPPVCRPVSMLCASQPPTAEMASQLPRSKLRCAEAFTRIRPHPYVYPGRENVSVGAFVNFIVPEIYLPTGDFL